MGLKPVRSAPPPWRPPAGGPAAIAGFAYQLLGSLDWATSVLVAGPGDANSVTVTFEPGAGGDAVHARPDRREVIQFKSRGKGGWTDLALAREVLPDLARAGRAEADETVFRLQTDARDRRSAGLQRLQALAAEHGAREGVALARGEGLVFKGPRDVGNLHVDDFLKLAAGGGQAQALDVARVLARFEITPLLAAEVLIDRIEHRIAQVLPYPEASSDRRQALIGQLVEMASQGDALWDLAALLDKLGLPAPDLRRNARMERALGERLVRDLRAVGYEPGLDARIGLPSIERSPLVLSGPSGVGKTWMLAAVAARASEAGVLVLWLDGPQGRDQVRRDVVDRVQAARGFSDQTANPEALGSLLAGISPASARFRLVVVLDRFRSLPEAQSILTDRWWDEQGVEVVAALPAAPGVRLDGLEPHEVHEFSHTELRDFLVKRGHTWASVVHDVRRLIRRPALAKLYVQIAGQSVSYHPETEYSLIDAAWTRTASASLTLWRVARARLSEAVTKTLRQILTRSPASYPWPVAGANGFTGDEVECLERAGLLRWADERHVMLDHDRLLAWALAEAAERQLAAGKVTVQALIRLSERAAAPGGAAAGLPGHALNYLPLDLLWRLTGPSHDLAVAAELTRALVKSGRGLDWADVATLGSRSGELLLRLAETWSEAELNYSAQLGEALAITLKGAPEASIQRLLKLLSSSELVRRQVALRVLELAPRSGMLRRAVNIHAAAATQDQVPAIERLREQAFATSRALALAYPGELENQLKDVSSGPAARTLGWVALELPPTAARQAWARLRPHLALIEDRERERLVSSAMLIAAEPPARPVIGEGIYGSYAFGLFAAAYPNEALQALAHARGKAAEAAISGAEILFRTVARTDDVVAAQLADGFPPKALVFEMSPWAALAGPKTWSALLDAPSPFTWHGLHAFADAPSSALVAQLQRRATSAFERSLARLAARRLANADIHFVDHELENAEEILLRVGGPAYARQVVRRLGQAHINLHDRGLAGALVSDAPAVRAALRRLVSECWAARRHSPMRLQPLERFAVVDPEGARRFARRLLREPWHISWAYAGQIALYLSDHALGLAALTALGKTRHAHFRIEVNLVAAFDPNPSVLRRLAETALRRNDPQSRYLAAWIGVRQNDRRLLRRILGRLLPAIRKQAQSSDRHALAVIVSDPELRAEVQARMAEDPRSLLAWLMEEIGANAEWTEPLLQDAELDGALQFENTSLGVPQDGLEKLLRQGRSVGLEVFDEGLRRGGRASAGLARYALENYPDDAPKVILERLMDVENGAVRLDVGRALRGGDWSKIVPMIAERLLSEERHIRLGALAAASWFPDARLEPMVLQIFREDPRGAVRKAAGELFDRWDVLRFIMTLAGELEHHQGEERRRRLAIMSGADRDSVMRTPADPLHVDVLTHDARERMVVFAFKRREAAK